MGILTRAAKGTALTHTELDANQIFLRDRHGFADYNDAATVLAPIDLVTDTWTTLTNDSLGPNTLLTYLPIDVAALMSAGGNIDVTDLTIGSDIIIRHDFIVTPDAQNLILSFRYMLGTGAGSYTLESSLGKLDSGVVGHRFALTTNYIYIGDSNTRDNPIVPQVRLSGNGEVINSGMVIRATQHT